MDKQEEIISRVLAALKIGSLNEMQQAAIEAQDKNNDVMLLSPTGTGKTLAFLLPLLMGLDAGNEAVQAVIIAPSRELALQIEQVFKSLGSAFKICCCYGGHPISIEKRSLSHPTAVLVGTPGRLLDHMEKNNVDVSQVKRVVLDEFDKSLEFGFQEEMAAILGYLPRVEKRILTSATNALRIPSFVGLRMPVKLDYLDITPKPTLTIRKVLSEDKDKLETFYRLLCKLDGSPTLVFCNYRESVERVSSFLDEKNVDNEYFHGGMEQVDRERALAKFRSGSANVFISTDLASRGLDIPEIKYIIHYHVPESQEAFIHRNGRTARMNAEGTAYVIVHTAEELPLYVEEIGQFESLKSVPDVPVAPRWITLYIGKGKKDKLNKVDIVGFLCQKGELQKEDIGHIEVKDYQSYVAINRSKLSETLKRVSQEKIKNMRTKIDIAD